MDKYDSKVKQGVNKQIYKSAYAIHANAIGILKTGLKTTSRKLETSLRVVTNAVKFYAEVVTDYFVAPFIELGTKPHRITAKNTNALSFFWSKINARVVVPKSGGFKTFYSKGILFIGKGYVDHPGTKALEFLKRSANKEQPNYIQGILNILKTT